MKADSQSKRLTLFLLASFIIASGNIQLQPLSAPMFHPISVYFYISLNTSTKDSKTNGMKFKMTTKRGKTRLLKYYNSYRNKQRLLLSGDIEVNPGQSINFKFLIEHIA